MSDDARPAGDAADDIDALGASPTKPAGRPARSRRSRRASLRRLRRPAAVVAVVLLLVVALAVVPSVVGSLKKTPRNMVGISYGGGPIEAAHFQRVVEPGSGLFVNGLFDPLYLYPSDTQTYLVTKTAGEGAKKQADSIVSPSRDRVQVEYQVALYFVLNRDRLRQFHESLGLQYGAFTSSGWDALINDTFRQQIENVLQEETRRYDVAELYGSADDLTALQQAVEAKVSERLTEALGEPYFCGPTYRPGGECPPPKFVIKKIEIPEGVAAAFEENRTSEIDVLTSQNEIKQRAAEAQAIDALNKGLAAAGMPYVLLKAIESGQIKFWVLPSDSGVTLNAPEGLDGTTTTTSGGG